MIKIDIDFDAVREVAYDYIFDFAGRFADQVESFIDTIEEIFIDNSDEISFDMEAHRAQNY